MAAACGKHRVALSIMTSMSTNGRITGYQIIIPTTWNIAPRNAEGVRGPMEQALIGTPGQQR